MDVIDARPDFIRVSAFQSSKACIILRLVIESAGIKCSIRSDSTVMSRGMPKVVKVERKLNSPSGVRTRVSSKGLTEGVGKARLEPVGCAGVLRALDC